MKGGITFSGLKRGIILFWALWFLIVTFTNLSDALVTFGLLPFDWPSVSNNYLLIEKSISVYHLPDWVSELFFFTIIAWEAICSILFFRLFLRFRTLRPEEPAMLLEPFAAGIGLFCSFILACEIFLVYEIEGAHLRVFLALLVSLMFCYWKGGMADQI